MQVRAALIREQGAGIPFSVEDIELDDPKDHRGVDRSQGLWRVPFRRPYADR